MKKIKGALILSAVLCMLPCAANAAEIKLGNYLQMGMIYGEPILWRCGGFEKISGYDNNNPIINSYDTSREYKEGYIPLLISDEVITIKAFDVAGYLNIETGSHSHYDETIYTTKRNYVGSNYWADSNIRSWLISDAPEGGINWLCGNPPVESYYLISEGEKLSIHYPNGYAYDAGFLHNFTYNEKRAIQPSVQETKLSWQDKQSIAGAGDTEYCTDTVFLPDERQLNTVRAFDKKYALGILNAAAANNLKTIGGLDWEREYYPSNPGVPWAYWLRTPEEGRCDGVLIYRNEEVVDAMDSLWSAIGVRPMFHLAPEAQFASGDGTKENPYTIAETLTEPNKEPEKEITVTLNGSKIEFEQPPVIRGDRTLVPFRAIFEALGCDVKWDEQEKAVAATKAGYNSDGGLRIKLMINYNIMSKKAFTAADDDDSDMPIDYKESELIEMDYPPIIINGYTMIPVRAVSEALDCTVGWDGGTQTVTIVSAG